MTTTTVASTTTLDDSNQQPAASCPATDDVADVVGHDVNQSMNAGGSGSLDFQYSYDGCSYDGNGNSYSITRATVASEADGFPFDLLERAARAELETSGFTPVDDLGDDAYLDGPSLAVRNGDTMVIVRVDDPDDQDVTADRDALADDLASLDLSGDDPSCTTPAGAVANTFGPVGEPRFGGGGSSDGGVEIDYTTCIFENDDGIEISVDVARDAPWDDWVEAKRSSTFTASFEASSIGEYATFDNGEELFVDESDRPLRITSSMPDASFDDAMATRLALAELALAV